LYILIFTLLTEDEKTKGSELNGSQRYPNLIYSQLPHDLLLSLSRCSGQADGCADWAASQALLRFPNAPRSIEYEPR
jgi:hypothetical protein